MPVKIIQKEASEAGYSWATIRRAKERLGIEAERTGGVGKAGRWEWVLPKMLKNPLRCSLSEGEHLTHLSENLSTLGDSDSEWLEV
ncbi:AAA ATPase [Hydrogenophilus thermoluteolus]|uniref:AAA ATPase n=1 Tax=Hydrogenophilus thermoluteolus TaxID=297 RepID=A0A2Z6DYI6_HYDTE|nr:AAA ATPase [Hydrogenophilus thermoluteolus]